MNEIILQLLINLITHFFSFFLSDANSKVFYKPALACEDRMLYITCPHSSLVINVKAARYGRLLSQSNVCPKEDLRDCGENIVTPRVKERCQWKTECSFTANNYHLGSYCTNVYKYLKVFYECGKLMFIILMMMMIIIIIIMIMMLILLLLLMMIMMMMMMIMIIC